MMSLCSARNVAISCAVGGDQRRRHQILEQRDEQFLRRVAHMGRIVDDQRPGMDALEDMRRRDVGHVERRVLPHQHDIGLRQVVDARLAQREMIAFHRTDVSGRARAVTAPSRNLRSRGP